MDSPKKKQRRQSVINTTCIICSKLEMESELTKSNDKESLKVLLHASRAQNFSPILTLPEHQYAERSLYQRQCRMSRLTAVRISSQVP